MADLATLAKQTAAYAWRQVLTICPHRCSVEFHITHEYKIENRSYLTGEGFIKSSKVVSAGSNLLFLLQNFLVVRVCYHFLLEAVDSLMVRASDARPDGLGSIPDANKYPPSTPGVRAR
ncbi:hypothetical protein TNCV_4413231 [Trichonephila clavipes]|nr:hypothetical protein TNCV_4413231 [Trichonephila clavipes]